MNERMYIQYLSEVNEYSVTIFNIRNNKNINIVHTLVKLKLNLENMYNSLLSMFLNLNSINDKFNNIFSKCELLLFEVNKLTN
ncbi:hypothetical protein [Paraclostridium bifermentans]|uniref:hypothetical protein n=1 Tax=Paraclostridium bifermentans TaxID=1490 RepID=UPI00374E9D39